VDHDTLKGWIGDPESAPASQRAAVLTARAFLAGDDIDAHASDVAGLPGDIATALPARRPARRCTGSAAAASMALKGSGRADARSRSAAQRRPRPG
jgi:hypothetical protein